MKKASLIIAATALGTTLAAPQALAGGFALREQSASSQGASFAGAAAPGESPSAMFWNPAAITTTNGFVIESNGTIILPKSELSVDAARSPLSAFGFGNGGDVGIDAFVPSFYSSYQIDEQLYLGLSVNAPFGLGTHTEGPWVGQTDHDRAKVRTTAITPTLGYKVNDMLSLGVGLTAQYFKVDLSRSPVIAPPATFARAELEGDDWGFGATAGLTLIPFEGTEIGLGYRSPISYTLEGTQKLKTTGGATLSNLPIEAEATLPETVTLGVRQRVDDAFTLLAGVEWTNWSRLGTVPVTTTGGGTVSELVFEYGDGWFLSLGGEYAWNDDLTLRAGVAYEWSPVKDAHRSMRLPDNDRIWLSAGATWTFNDKISLDFAYTHIFVNDADLEVATDLTNGVIGYAGTAEGSIDIISAALRVKL
jgi:Long-chain fatty acid transport protein